MHTKGRIVNRATPAAFLLACVMVLAAPAMAEPYTVVPPDNSAADQYAEGFPGVDGDRRPDASAEPADGQGSGNKPRLPADARRGLSDLGGPGEAAALVLDRTLAGSPTPVSRDARTGGDAARPPTVRNPADPDEPDSGGLAAGFLGVTGGGMGLLLPLLLLMVAGVAIAIMARRDRRS